MKRIDNKGLSLVEMVAVIAIATLMLVFVTISIGTNTRNQALRTSEKLESLINQARTNALVKGTSKGYLNIAYVDGNYYTYVGELVTGGADGNANKANVKKKGQRLCDGGLDIFIASVNVKDSDDVRYLSFKQSTGGLVASGTDIPVLVKKGMTSSTKIVDWVTGKIE